MSKRLPTSGALYRLGTRDRSALLETLADQLRDEIVRLQHGGAPYAAMKNARRRLRRVYSAADRFGIYVGQASSGFTSPAFVRLITRAIARYSVDDAPSVDQEDLPDPKPRIRREAISVHWETKDAA